MAFPTLFPIGTSMLLQPRIHEVDMHEYALHLIRIMTIDLANILASNTIYTI